MTRLWGGRFDAEPAPELIAFTRSAQFDVRLAAEDCRVLAAHARALAAAGVLDDAQAGRAAELLPTIGLDIASGAFAVSDGDEDVHSTVERALLERDADLGARIRAGISRNDRVATAFRLWVASAAGRLAAATASFRNAIERRSSEHREALMPGYTHLQRAQPVTLGYHLAAHAAAVGRAEVRLVHASAGALKWCPLGAGALAGSTLPLNREMTARELGFTAPAANAIDAVADRDFAAEFLFAGAMLGVASSRLSEEIVLWTSSEFGFATLDDAWSTGSSLMPQKRNPDVAELARGKTGRLIGDLTGLLVALKGLPLAYNRDLQEDKEPVFDAHDTLAAMLPALAGVVSTLRFDVTRMRAAAADGTLLATDLAEYLVTKGVPFRDAHDAVGSLVRTATERGIDIAALSLEDFRAANPAFEPDVTGILDPAGSVRRRGV